MRTIQITMPLWLAEYLRSVLLPEEVQFWRYWDKAENATDVRAVITDLDKEFNKLNLEPSEAEELTRSTCL